MEIPTTLQAVRARLDLTRKELAERLGVSSATVNRWEGGTTKPQRAAYAAIAALAAEAGIDAAESFTNEAKSATRVVRRPRLSQPAAFTKSMEQMLWNAACSIRGAQEAAKFKDYLLPILFLKRLSDVFDDEINQLAEELGDVETAKEIAESDHELLRFYLPPEARWSVVSGRETHEWQDQQGQSTVPKDSGEHLTKAVKAVAHHNPTLAGVIDLVDFAAERNGERDINPAKLAAVIETFSDPRYRLGLADVQPDFLGRAYEYLLRKFAEDSGQSAGEFFTPTEVGFLMAHLMHPRPGETCHDYACGSGGLLIKLQLAAREFDPTSQVPLNLCGQEIQSESYAVAHMNAIIHDMDVEIARGDTMLNPRFRNAAGQIKSYDIVVANPMWNQHFDQQIFADDPFDRFRPSGGTTTSRGDWAWLQHTLVCLNECGRAAVVLDTGAVTRGSRSKNEDRESSIRKWFVDNDLVDGVILLPENLFYNTSAAGIIIVLSKHKPKSRRGKIVLLNASRHVRKGQPKNYIPEEDIRPLAAAFLKGEPVEGEIAVITQEQAREADYNLSPSHWVGHVASDTEIDIQEVMRRFESILAEESAVSADLQTVLQKAFIHGLRHESRRETEIGLVPESWSLQPLETLCDKADTVDLRREGHRMIQYVDVSSISRESLQIESTTRFKLNKAPGRARKRILKGDVIFATVRPTLLRTAVVPEELHNQVCSTAFCVLRQNQRTASNFVYYVVQRNQFIEQLAHIESGASYPAVTDRIVKEQAVPVPPLKEQQQIVTILEATNRAIDMNRQKRAILVDLFKALLHKLMTGEIRVGDVDRTILNEKFSHKEDNK